MDRNTNYHKDDILTVQITDIGSAGEGIGKVDGFTLFIKDAIMGDVVRCKIMKVQKGYAFARLLEVITPSKDRVEPSCPLARPCGGCQIQELSYEKQLSFKQNKVRNDIIRIGGFTEAEADQVMQPIVGMDEPFRYRNKAQIPVSTDKDGNLVAGFYAGRTHAIVPMGDCLIGQQGNREIMEAVLSYMKEKHVTSYNEQTGKGLVRHILIRTGIYSGEVMVCLILNGKKLPEEQRLVETLRAIDGMTSITLNTNTQKTNVIMGRESRTLWGRDTIQDTLHVFDVEAGSDPKQAVSFRETEYAVSFNISAQSFYQVNPHQTERLYSIVREYAGLTGQQTVWDLYCGVGTISLFLARDAKSMYGVEVIPSAIEDAKKNAQLNGITNAVYQVGKVEEVLPAYVKEAGNDSVDVVVVDPPRKGCDPLTLQTILEVAPPKLVYVSCDPATLARDLKILRAGGYRVDKVQPVDQFAHTVHVETVALLTRI